jgi:hypothetical protein
MVKYFYVNAWPLAETCSKAAWDNAKVWGYTDAEARSACAKHLHKSGKHYLTASDAENLAKLADMVTDEWEDPSVKATTNKRQKVSDEKVVPSGLAAPNTPVAALSQTSKLPVAVGSEEPGANPYIADSPVVVSKTLDAALGAKAAQQAPPAGLADYSVVVSTTSVHAPAPKAAQQAPPAGYIHGVKLKESLEAMTKSALALRHAQSLSQSAAKAFGQQSNIVEALVVQMKKGANVDVD